MPTKICSKCHEEKDIENFSKNKRRKDGIQTFCKPCQNKYGAVYYEKDPKSQIVRARKVTSRLREKINKIKRDIGCKFCEENEPCCLDFHHLRDKKFAVSRGYVNIGIESLIEEMTKCILVCSNCHRKIHAGIIDTNGSQALTVMQLAFNQ